LESAARDRSLNLLGQGAALTRGRRRSLNLLGQRGRVNPLCAFSRARARARGRPPRPAVSIRRRRRGAIG
jgi:hypothetical protein